MEAVELLVSNAWDGCLHLCDILPQVRLSYKLTEWGARSCGQVHGWQIGQVESLILQSDP